MSFLIANARFLTFGFLAAFFSSFGQTFFISLSSADVRSEFALSHGDFGLIYMVGTLSSAALLIWAGRKIDEMDLRLYTALVAGGLAIACFAMAHVPSPLWLILAIFALRFTGQGLMTHISLVSMARYFDKKRGKALSIGCMGFPAGEAVFPTLGVALIVAVGWRDAWQNLGLALLIGLVPLLLWLLRGHGERHRRVTDHERESIVKSATGWTRAQVLRDVRFYVIMPSYLAMSFIGTGFFFHQAHLSESKGWSLALFASFFVVYAGAQIAAALGAGFLVDRVSAKRLLPFYLVPAMFGLLVLSMDSSLLAGIAFMALMGTSAGFTSVVHGAIWAEIYGIRHIGAIKALGTALMVFSSAMSPPVMGLAIDANIHFDAIAIMCAVFILLSALLIFCVFRHLN